MRRLLIFSFAFSLVMIAGCRSHKEVAEDVTYSDHDSVVADVDIRTQVEEEELNDFSFSAENMEYVFMADSIKVGDSVIYKPQMSAAYKKPVAKNVSAKKEESSQNVKADLKAGADVSLKKDLKEISEVSHPLGRVFIAALLGLLTLLLFYWVIRRNR